MFFLVILTEGRAKKEMENIEKHEAMIFPSHVMGTLSPYPIVVNVTYGGKKLKKKMHIIQIDREIFLRRITHCVFIKNFSFCIFHQCFPKVLFLI